MINIKSLFKIGTINKQHTHKFMHSMGKLVLIGGSEDRTNDKKILMRTLAINQPKKIIIIPTASRYGAELGQEYVDAFAALGYPDSQILDIRYQDVVDTDENLEMIRGAELIFFTGGDQVRLVETFKDSRVITEIKHLFQKGATIAGTSAGAAAASNPMIYDGDDYGLNKGSVNWSEGFGFISHVTIDTHFIARGRISRLSQFLSTGNSQYGIGIEEDTGIIVYPDDTFEVIGNDAITVLSAKQLKFSSYHEIEHDHFLTIDGLDLSYLAEGTFFNLQTWRTMQQVGAKK